jgi:hypothetical protein
LHLGRDVDDVGIAVGRQGQFAAVNGHGAGS